MYRHIIREFLKTNFNCQTFIFVSTISTPGGAIWWMLAR